MSYRLKRNEDVLKGVQRITREQIEKSLGEIDDTNLSVHETIHQVRKRCKKIRAVIRLVRPNFEKRYQKENKRYRDAARKLAMARDATSVIECFDALVERFEDADAVKRLQPFRDALKQRHQSVVDDQNLDAQLSDFRAELEHGHEVVSNWKFEETAFDAIGPGLKKTYSRARDAWRNVVADPSPENVHEWRKRAKYNRYHTRLLQDSWTQMQKPRRKALNRLTDLLGDHHDLAVLRDVLADESAALVEPEDRSALLGLMELRQAELLAWAKPLGQRLFAAKPREYIRQQEAYFNAWRSERVLKSALAAPSDIVYS